MENKLDKFLKQTKTLQSIVDHIGDVVRAERIAALTEQDCCRYRTRFNKYSRWASRLVHQLAMQGLDMANTQWLMNRSSEGK
jgi:hypothetical protein